MWNRGGGQRSRLQWDLRGPSWLSFDSKLSLDMMADRTASLCVCLAATEFLGGFFLPANIRHSDVK
jgi:hypothetical protein